MVIGQVLIEFAARDECEQLHAEADAEDRNLRSGEQGLDEFDLVTLPLRVHGCCRGVGRLTEGLGTRIIAAGENEAVKGFKLLGDKCLVGRDEHGQAPGHDDGAGVVE